MRTRGVSARDRTRVIEMITRGEIEEHRCHGWANARDDSDAVRIESSAKVVRERRVGLRRWQRGTGSL